jgi:hypothetical protein
MIPREAARRVASPLITIWPAPGPRPGKGDPCLMYRPGVPGTGRTSQILPVLVKASATAWIAIDMDLAGRPRGLDGGVNVPLGAASGELLICPLGSLTTKDR